MRKSAIRMVCAHDAATWNTIGSFVGGLRNTGRDMRYVAWARILAASDLPWLHRASTQYYHLFSDI